MRNRLFVPDFSTCIQLGGLSALLVPVLMGGGPGLRKFRAKPTKCRDVLRWTKTSSEWVDWH